MGSEAAPIIVRPNRALEDRTDIAVVAAAAALLVLAAGALLLLVYEAFGPGPTILILPLLSIGFSLHAVEWLRIDEQGIRFGRRWGTPKFLPWTAVRHIRPATRREVVLFGWLWPPFPPREATRALTSVGHYRIEWEGGYCYFPPDDEGTFRRAVERWGDSATALG
jgi:hypothetical protein